MQPLWIVILLLETSPKPIRWVHVSFFPFPCCIRFCVTVCFGFEPITTIMVRHYWCCTSPKCLPSLYVRLVIHQSEEKESANSGLHAETQSLCSLSHSYSARRGKWLHNDPRPRPPTPLRSGCYKLYKGSRWEVWRSIFHVVAVWGHKSHLNVLRKQKRILLPFWQ